MEETLKETMLRHLKELTTEMAIPPDIVEKERKIIDELVSFKRVKNTWS